MYFDKINSYFGQAVYDTISRPFLNQSTLFIDNMDIQEWHLYGSSRIGIKKADIQLAYLKFNASNDGSGNFGAITNTQQTFPALNDLTYTQQRGAKNYELVNHLGNVLVVVTDKKIPTCSGTSVSAWQADVVSATDYSAFGAPLAGRTYNVQETQHKLFVAGQEFTTGTDSWAATGSSTTIANSSGRLSFTTTNTATTYMSKSYTVNTGKHYRLNLDVDAGSVSNATLTVIGTGSVVLSTYNFTGSTHQQMDFRANGTSITIKVSIGSGSGSRVVYIDNLKLEEITGDLSGYRFGFNGQEKDDDIDGAGNTMSAEFWEYDARLGRRWNMDPIYSASVSVYVVNGNNPIYYNDPSGAFKTWFGAFIYKVAHGGDISKAGAYDKNHAGEYFVGSKVESASGDGKEVVIAYRRVFSRPENVPVPDKYSGVEGYRAYQSYPFEIPGETWLDRWARRVAANHREEMLDYGGGGYNMFGGYGRASEASSVAGSIRKVNPTEGSNNCVNCSVATDATLAGRPACAMPGQATSISVLEREFGGTFIHKVGINEIKSMVNAGERGIVFGSRGPGQVGHVFNVVNQKGIVRFLDGQTGRPANFNGYTSFSFLKTN